MDRTRHERLARRWPLGAAVSLQQLDVDPHPVLARLREHVLLFGGIETTATQIGV